jgi:hypothetical protein
MEKGIQHSQERSAMTPPTAILRFHDTEISTTDEVTVQSLWRLLAHSVTAEERQAVDGRSTEFQEQSRPPVRLVAIEGGE